MPAPARPGGALAGLRSAGRRAGWLLKRVMPKGLYARSLLIVIAPVVLLQSVIAYAFMERHWQTVTNRLSASVAADIASIPDGSRKTLSVEHPTGEMTCVLTVDEAGSVTSAALLRTARKLMDGVVFG